MGSLIISWYNGPLLAGRSGAVAASIIMRRAKSIRALLALAVGDGASVTVRQHKHIQ
jgi:hypothetical protein